MGVFREYLNNLGMICEKVITLGDKRPKYNNVIIMAGGVGSGKSFVIEKLLGIEGKVLNVDDLKDLIVRTTILASNIENKYGINIKGLSLKNDKHVKILHELIEDMKLGDKRNKILFNSIMLSENKPNLIFDVTMKDITKLEDISKQVTKMGYDKKNIHIIWVVNDMETAIQQNAERDRVVPLTILKHTHENVSYTIKRLLDGKEIIRDYMDGEFWIVFNKKYIDTLLAVSNYGGSYVKKASYTKVKDIGKTILSVSQISDNVISKIKEYVPNPELWEK